MIGIKLEQAKGGFFDSAKVQKAMDRVTIRALSKFGAFVRRRARSSIRKRKASSQPGQPPSSHTGKLRDGILFVADLVQKNVIIGPTLLNSTAARAGSGTGPGVLEHGGTLIMARGRGRRRRILKTVDVAARPSMQPAFDAEIDKAPYLWENGIRA